MISKRIIATILSVSTIATYVTTYTTNAVTVDSESVKQNIINVSDNEENVVYRKSVKGKNKDKIWEFIYALTAYDNGHIHIDIQCETGNYVTCGVIGNFQFNDSMIAAVGQEGYAGTSSFDNYKLTASKYTTSFSDDDSSYVVYTSLFNAVGTSYAATMLMSFDLYVKEPYLKTNQPMVLFGEKIEIPFGEPLNKDAKIKELEEKVSSLELSLATLQNNTLRLDANGDGAVNAVDASIVLSIYAYNSTNNTPIKTLSDYFQNIK
ncbi:hypothetical protein [Ruminococcus sp.]|uniref:hypothetical protein n=1 Tax=Ruminococcus sp. TaxID=41978 RepID=UPI0025F0998D|nr:hypothetical protein [Ruminococcus sp.]MCR4638964.1 hypothetical protein [Ruminococcus sp.]